MHSESVEGESDREQEAKAASMGMVEQPSPDSGRSARTQARVECGARGTHQTEDRGRAFRRVDAAVLSVSQNGNEEQRAEKDDTGEALHKLIQPLEWI
jgi:hypothetical protein